MTGSAWMFFKAEEMNKKNVEVFWKEDDANALLKRDVFDL